MNASAAIKSGPRREDTPLGRKPSADPKKHQIAFRVNQETFDRLSRELDKEQAMRPGLELSIGDVVRILMHEALMARASTKTKK